MNLHKHDVGFEEAKTVFNDPLSMSNKMNSNSSGSEDHEMLPEYDFSGGARGKHYRAYRKGYSVTVHHSDGSSIVQYVPPEGMVMLEPDVREYFRDSEAVNRALRSLIALFPSKRETP